MYAAAALSVLFGTVLVMLIIKSSSPRQAQFAQADSDPANVFTPLIDPELGGSGASGGSGLFIQVTDKNNPDRLSMELRSKQMDPIGPDLYSVDQPRAWVFLNDGSSISITATDGTLLLPDRAREPEQGTLTGGVVIRRYPDLGRRADPDTDTPEATFKSESLSFDLPAGEITTPDRVIVTSDVGELAGTNLQMNFNEQHERIDLFRLKQGEYLRLFRDRPSHTNSPASSAKTDAESPPAPADDANAQATAAGSTQNQTPPEPTPDLLESFYRGVFKDQVVLTDRGRTITGDQLELWIRLVDNKLVPGAIEDAPTSDQPPPTSPADTQPNTPAAASAMTPAGDPPPSSPAANPIPVQGSPEKADPDPIDRDILLTWTGVVEIRPKTSRPDELERDEVAARFTASKTGRVQLKDPHGGAHASTGSLDYYATRRHLVMASPGITGVELVSDGHGLARFARFELNLATGIGHAPGAGLVENASGRGSVTWNEQADLLFAVDRSGITGELQEAMCSGGVRAQRDDSTLESDFLRTTFITNEQGDLRLQRLAARGQVKVSDGRQAGGTCAKLDVGFDASDDRQDPTPTDLLARGDAQFNDGDDRIAAEIIDATLKPTETQGTRDGGVKVKRLHTMGATRITRARDQLEVSGGDVLMFDDRQSVRIQGPDALAQRSGVRITAAGRDDVINLDGTGRNGTVTGAGSFHRSSANPDGSTGTISATWTRSMTFDDLAGTLHCVGEVRAVHSPDVWRRDAVMGREVTATFEPYRENPPESEDQSDDRKVLTFVALGDTSSQTQAAVESARFEAVPGGEPRLARALRITGYTVSLDQARSVVEVPGPGTLLVSDQRQNLPEQRKALALFSWSQSFVHDRNAGRATMIGTVESKHRRRADDPLTLIESDRMYAVLIDPQRGDLSGDPTNEAQLRSARAEGNVSMRSGPKEALANVIDYDAIKGTASITGRPGGYVTMLDTSRTGMPTKAGRIFWDLTRDRIDIINAGPFRGSP